MLVAMLSAKSLIYVLRIIKVLIRHGLISILVVNLLIELTQLS